MDATGLLAQVSARDQRVLTDLAALDPRMRLSAARSPAAAQWLALIPADVGPAARALLPDADVESRTYLRATLDATTLAARLVVPGSWPALVVAAHAAARADLLACARDDAVVEHALTAIGQSAVATLTISRAFGDPLPDLARHHTLAVLLCDATGTDYHRPLHPVQPAERIPYMIDALRADPLLPRAAAVLARS